MDFHLRNLTDCPWTSIVRGHKGLKCQLAQMSLMNVNSKSDMLIKFKFSKDTFSLCMVPTFYYLNNYFRLHVCLSFFKFVCWCICLSHFTISTPQNMTNQRCLACARERKKNILGHAQTLESTRLVKAEPLILQY